MYCHEPEEVRVSMYIGANRVSVLVQMRIVGRLAMGLLRDDRSRSGLERRD